MKFNYFYNCKSVEEVKKTYRNLCFKYHPDLPTGNCEVMKEINAEYEKAFKFFQKDEQVRAKSQSAEIPEDFKNIINKLINLEGVKIEIVGTWVWLSGETTYYKELLKSVGFRWSAKKNSWYYTADKLKKHATKMTLEEIKNKYGCKVVANKMQSKLT